jgi:hypothetical protein
VDAAIDRAFIYWSSSWAIDRYRQGSAHVTNMDCGGRSCRALGQFSFFRNGAVLTIGFTAAIGSDADGNRFLDRVCYDDITTGTRDCIE